MGFLKLWILIEQHMDETGIKKDELACAMVIQWNPNYMMRLNVRPARLC